MCNYYLLHLAGNAGLLLDFRQCRREVRLSPAAGRASHRRATHYPPTLNHDFAPLTTASFRGPTSTDGLCTGHTRCVLSSLLGPLNGAIRLDSLGSKANFPDRRSLLTTGTPPPPRHFPHQPPNRAPIRCRPRRRSTGECKERGGGPQDFLSHSCNPKS